MLTSLNRSDGIPQVKCNNRWIGVLIGFGDDWDPRYWYMNYERESRVAREDPKTEKRWIGVYQENGGYYTTQFSGETTHELKSKIDTLYSGFRDWQFIEIEVEI